jgi:RNA polymerase sigma-70 factor (ECF subfamily)
MGEDLCMAFTEIDEKLLVRAYQAGDERAFDTIVRTQYNALYAHALKRLMQHEAAEDAVQDTMLRAYRALPNLDGDLALRAWLHRILTNVCHDEGNRRRRQQGIVEKVGALPEEHAPDPVDDTVLLETVQVMSNALKELPEAYREALVLRYVDGLSFREVGEATGVTEENARARVHRGRQALHKILTRVSVMAAFIIPGLKRTHTAPAGPTDAVAVEPVSLVTQLTAHAAQAAPHVSRLAELSATLPGGKSTLAAAAVTAVAAVAAPVAYTVNEVRTPESDRPAVVASAPTTVPNLNGPITVVSNGTSTTVGLPAAESTTTLPASQTNPFAARVGTSSATTAPKPSTTTTTAPSVSGTVLTGSLGGDSLGVSGSLPQFDLDGGITLTGTRTVGGTLTGRIFLFDDGSVQADRLTLVLDNGSALDLRLRARWSTASSGVYQFASGRYSLVGGSTYGLAESGDVVGSLEVADGRGGLRLDFRGQGAS